MVRDRVLETLRLAASELKSDVSASSTNPAYEKPPEIPAAVNLFEYCKPETMSFPVDIPASDREACGG